MAEYLVFRIYGPFASWGDIAVGEVRPSANHPSKSQILGLLCSALGIKRSDKENLCKVFSGYEIAEKVIDSGTLLRDYHTIQVTKKGKRQFYSRRDEFNSSKKEINTILSSREYYCDAEVVISVRKKENIETFSFIELQKALQFPKFVLYLGRKSCPLALPVLPQIIQANGFKESFNKAYFPSKVDNMKYFSKSQSIRYYWEGEAFDMKPTQINERYDEPVNKEKWQFVPRAENYYSEDGGNL